MSVKRKLTTLAVVSAIAMQAIAVPVFAKVTLNNTKLTNLTVQPGATIDVKGTTQVTGNVTVKGSATFNPTGAATNAFATATLTIDFSDPNAVIDLNGMKFDKLIIKGNIKSIEGLDPSLLDKIEVAPGYSAPEYVDTSGQSLSDFAAAKGVDKVIEALPAVDALTLGDKAAVEGAKVLFNALTDAQKAIVKQANKTSLDAAVAKIADLEAAVTANAVNALIEALPAVDSLKVTDKAKVEAARVAFEALTDVQKAKVTQENKTHLIASVAKIADLETEEAAKAVDALIEALPAVVNLALADKDDVEAARAAYEALTNAQKAKVKPASTDKLVAAEAQMLIVIEYSKVASVEIVNQASDAKLTVGSSTDSTLILQAVAKNNKGNAIAGKTATFTSSDATIATVDSNGKVTAVAEGTATITATIDDKSATFDVEVAP